MSRNRVARFLHLHGSLAAVALVAMLFLAPGCTSDEERLAQYQTQALEEREAGNHDASRLLLQMALALAPKDAQINLELARTFTRLGRFDDASFYFGEAYRLDPSLSEAALSRAPLLYGTDVDAARSLVREVLEREPANALAHVRHAELLLLDGNSEDALVAAHTARELAPRDPVTHRMVGTVYHVRLQERSVAGEGFDESLAQKALDAFHGAQEVDSRAWLDLQSIAGVYADWPGREGDMRAALEKAFESAKAEGEEDAMRGVTTEAERVAAAAKDTDLLRWAAERRVEVDPDRLRTWQQLARLAETEEPGTADAVWKRALEARPDDPLIHVGYASYLGTRTDSAAALGHLESVPPSVAGSPEIDLMRVKIYSAQGQMDQARVVLSRMKSAHGSDPLTTFAEARVALSDGDTDRAVALMRSVSGRLERSDVYRMLAEAEAGRGNPAPALAALNQALELSDDKPLSLFRERNRLLAATGDWQGLLQSLREMRRVGPGWGPVERLQLVHAQYQLGHDARGRALLDRLLEAGPPSLALIQTFVRYEGHRDSDRARELLVTALEQAPQNPILAASLAQLELAADRPDAAFAALEPLGDPGNLQAGLRLLRAQAFEALGRWPDAEVEARAAFEAENRPALAAQTLARTLRAQNRLDAAIAILEEARADGGLPAVDLWLLGRLYLETGQLAKSRIVLEDAVGAAPDLHAARNDLAYVLAETGEDLDRALDLARQAKTALPGDPAVGDTLGRVYHMRGLYEPAVSEFRSAIAEAAGEAGDEELRADIRYHLALSLQELGRTDEAARTLDEALAIRPEHEKARALREQIAATAPSPTGG